MMCNTIDVEKFEIDISKGHLPKDVLAFASIAIGEMRVNGFVISQGPDRRTGKLNTYVRPPSSPKRFGHQKKYFWIENEEKWAKLQERILDRFREKEEREPPFI